MKLLVRSFFSGLEREVEVAQLLWVNRDAVDPGRAVYTAEGIHDVFARGRVPVVESDEQPGLYERVRVIAHPAGLAGSIRAVRQQLADVEAALLAEAASAPPAADLHLPSLLTVSGAEAVAVSAGVQLLDRAQAGVTAAEVLDAAEQVREEIGEGEL